MPGSGAAGGPGRTAAAIKQPAVLNYLQRLFLICDLTHQPADSFTSFKTPVETLTNPYIIVMCIAHYDVAPLICEANSNSGVTFLYQYSITHHKR